MFWMTPMLSTQQVTASPDLLVLPEASPQEMRLGGSVSLPHVPAPTPPCKHTNKQITGNLTIRLRLRHTTICAHSSWQGQGEWLEGAGVSPLHSLAFQGLKASPVMRTRMHPSASPAYENIHLCTESLNVQTPPANHTTQFLYLSCPLHIAMLSWVPQVLTLPAKYPLCPVICTSMHYFTCSLVTIHPLNLPLTPI